MNWNQNLPKLLEIAKKAGQEILKIYHSENFGVTEKKDESPLTLADQASNKVICEGLKQIFPDIPIISEENKEIAYENRKNYELFWLVDPLDGTKEFIKRNGDFTVNIALVKENEVIAGIVYTPVTDDLYYAHSGEGAYHIIGGKPVKMSASIFSKSDKNLGIVCSRSHMSDETKAFVDQYDEPNLVSRGSSLKFLILATGDAAVYPRLAPTMEWDTAAAQIILEEAGGKVINVETGDKLKYNKEILRNPYFVAYGRLQE